ncbi:MAG: ATP-binding protein, partial [Desulfobacterales bacterium]|nr:ATP-binding protein [Desulfobacterales bacterium]
MKKAESMNWFEINQRCLVEALAEVREIFRERSRSGKEARPVIEMGERERETRPAENPAMTPAPPALETLCSLFGLSVFERRVLLLCAGMDLDSAFPAMVAEAHGDPRRAAPTFSLALSAFPDAHWSAFSPGRPLRYWRFIELEPGESLTRRGLCIDERILHYLTGVHHPDERLAGCVTPVEAADELTLSQRAAADRLVAGWSNLKSGERLPVVNLSGGDPAGRRDIAAAACQRLGVDLLAMSARSIPLEPRELEALTRLWEREAVLGNCALLLDCENLDPSDVARAGAVDDLIEGARAALIVTGARRPLDIRRPSLPLTAPSPTTGERILVWQNTLGPAVHRIDGGPDSLAAQFSLSPSNIRAACLEGLVKANGGRASRSNPRGDGLADALWSACRKRTRPRLSDLARRIEPAAGWEDLVLPENQRRILREIGIHVRHRAMVHETWGFAAKCGRGLGINSLFVGPSGTGKTMAAEVLANELRLDLYRVDLSQVVSKYIGETEKNLR